MGPKTDNFFSFLLIMTFLAVTFEGGHSHEKFDKEKDASSRGSTAEQKKSGISPILTKLHPFPFLFSFT